MSEIDASRRIYGEVTIDHLLNNDYLRFFSSVRVMCFALSSRAEPSEPKPEFKLNSWPSNAEIIYGRVCEQVKTIQRPYKWRGWNPYISPFRVTNLVLGSGGDIDRLITLEEDHMEEKARVSLRGDLSEMMDVPSIGRITWEKYLLSIFFKNDYEKILENANSAENVSLLT